MEYYLADLGAEESGFLALIGLWIFQESSRCIHWRYNYYWWWVSWEVDGLYWHSGKVACHFRHLWKEFLAFSFEVWANTFSSTLQVVVDLLLNLVAVGLAEVIVWHEVHVKVKEHKHVPLYPDDLFSWDGTMGNLFGNYLRVKWVSIFHLGSHVHGSDATFVDVSVFKDHSVVVASCKIFIKDGDGKEPCSLWALEACTDFDHPITHFCSAFFCDLVSFKWIMNCIKISVIFDVVLSKFSRILYQLLLLECFLAVFQLRAVEEARLLELLMSLLELSKLINLLNFFRNFFNLLDWNIITTFHYFVHMDLRILRFFGAAGLVSD